MHHGNRSLKKSFQCIHSCGTRPEFYKIFDVRDVCIDSDHYFSDLLLILVSISFAFPLVSKYVTQYV